MTALSVERIHKIIAVAEKAKANDDNADWEEVLSFQNGIDECDAALILACSPQTIIALARLALKGKGE